MKEIPDSYSLIVETDETNALILSEALEDWNLGVFLPERQGTARLEIFCLSRHEAEMRLSLLQTLAPKAEFGRTSIQKVVKQDWAESWKRHFHAQRVSDRIIVKPPWESPAAGPADCIVEIDPGMSFGTGLHGTTRACLRFLDAWQQKHPEASVLDLGCGTGILAIAAAKLGFPRVCALDNDPAAIHSTRNNVECNGVAGKVECIEADVATFQSDPPYDLVLANLLAGILTSWADIIIDALSRKPGSGLVLSGILDDQYEAVRSVFIARGFEEQSSLVLDGWQTGCFVRN